MKYLPEFGSILPNGRAFWRVSFDGGLRVVDMVIEDGFEIEDREHSSVSKDGRAPLYLTRSARLVL